MKNRYVIIVAAGTGSRIGGNLPKQFIPVQGKPILMHTLQKFHDSRTNPQIILVLSESMEQYWKSLCEEYQFTIPHHVCHGGNSRFQSVREGIRFLQTIHQEPITGSIAVHDAARPFITSTLIDQLFDSVEQGTQAVIPAVQSSSSVRLGKPENSKAINRDEVWLVQTPQVFDAQLLIAAYQQEEDKDFTDDASVVEKMSNNLILFPGEHQNLKITYEIDLAIAQLLLI